MTKTFVERLVQDPQRMRLFQQERAIYEVTELLENLMAETGVTRAELARKLGKSRGWVTQLLDGDANKTVRTVADAFAVLGHEYRSFHRPIKISTQGPTSKHKRQRFPKGWNEARVRKVLAHYKNQTVDEAVAEDEAAYEADKQTVMIVPTDLVPAIRELIARRRGA